MGLFRDVGLKEINRSCTRHGLGWYNMAFRYFSIRRISNNTVVNENEIDRQVCEKFNLNYSDEDYGHFFFTESEAEDFHQKSISWVGLLDWIVYHALTLTGSCRRSNLEIEAALAWTRQYVGMPESTVKFLSDLLEFFKENGYYVYVYGYSVDKEDDFFRNLYRGEVIFENESGVFLCDNSGELERFFPAIENLLDKSQIRERYSFHETYYIPCVHTLIIPEGVTSIARDFFRDGLVENAVSFPSTLKSIGDYAFSDSRLPDVIIPENVNGIGTFAFGNSIVRSVKFIRIFECEYLRQFKGAHIETLYLSKECQQQWQKGFDGYAFLHEVKDVEFY